MRKIIDLSGRVFNGVVVESCAGKDSTKKTLWNCRCFCGMPFQTTGLNLASGNTKSCGCLRRRPADNQVDIVGQTFGRLTVLSRVKSATGRRDSFLCLCICGKNTVVSNTHLKNGHTQSCGCLLREHLTINGKALAKRNGRGAQHPLWRGGFSTVRIGVIAWRREVFAREGAQCLVCHSTNKLHAHHLDSWAANPSLRTQPSNGVILCASCHRKFHAEVGLRTATRKNFIAFFERGFYEEQKLKGEKTK